jgi:hypothetical protein
VHCDEKQEQVSRLIDAELEESEQVTLFRHMENCPDCRLFLDSMIRFRIAAKRDKEFLFRAADESLPSEMKLPADRPRGVSGAGWLRVLGAGRSIPAPLAIGLAIVLLIFGIYVGGRIAMGPGNRGAALEREVGDGDGGVRPRVIVLCGLPEVEVLGRRPATTSAKTVRSLN